MIEKDPNNTVRSYPIPLYANVHIHDEYYIPRRYDITAIQTGMTTIVTTEYDHHYVIGQNVRLNIPELFGSFGLNNVTAIVISVPALNQVQLNLNSNGINPFIASPNFPPNQTKTVAQIIAIGDNNSGPINTQGRVNQITFIPGSFLDISPL